MGKKSSFEIKRYIPLDPGPLWLTGPWFQLGGGCSDQSPSADKNLRAQETHQNKDVQVQSQPKSQTPPRCGQKTLRVGSFGTYWVAAWDRASSLAETCEELNSCSTCLAPFKHPSLSSLRLHSGRSVRMSDLTHTHTQTRTRWHTHTRTHNPGFTRSFGSHVCCRLLSLEDLVWRSCSLHRGEGWEKPSEARPRRGPPGLGSTDAPLQVGRLVEL